MTSFAMLLKSFSDDVDYATRLVESFHRHNTESVHLYCVVPSADLPQFQPLASSTVTVMAEDVLADHLVSEPVSGFRPGYINQQIVKLAFWELGLADNYFCVDSEAVFLRDFGTGDFMHDPVTPYTVLVEDNELKVEPRYYRENWVGRERLIRRIADILDYNEPVLRTCHGHQVFSTTVLRSFRDEFLNPRGWDYRDAMAESPYEFSWYNLWLQKTRLIEIHQREPLVKVFHNENQHLEYVMRGITPDDIARGYLAVLINSNFSRGVGIISPHATKPDTIAPYLSYGELGSVARAKMSDTWRRRRPHRRSQ